MNQNTQPEPQQFDLLLKNARVIDPANSIDGVMDVGITAGTIQAVGPNLPASPRTQVLNLTGCLVTPGLIDIHTHVYPFPKLPSSAVESVHADAHLLASGVTTTVDVGTTGWQHFPHFYQTYIRHSKVRILALINIAAAGMVDGDSEQDPRQLNPHIAASVAQDYPDVIVGIKTAHYWTSKPWDADHQPWISVDRAVEAGVLCGKPVMVDFWPRLPERPYADLLLKHLRPGDIHTHVFAQQFPILNDAGKVNDFLWQARERGIWFDLGHGAASFWFRNAVPAFRDGFPPDTISTDLHMENINGPVVSMLHTMSKFLNIGMPLRELIYRSTTLPARVIGRTELGSLRVGSDADVAVLRLQESRFGFADCGRARLDGSQKLEALLTIRAGKIVYDPAGLSMPAWEQAPAPYWVNPTLQQPH